MIEFTAPPLTAPDRSIIGVIEEGAESRLAATPGRSSGSGPGDPMPEVPGNYILDHALSRSDAVAKSLAVARILELRRAGATIALITHDETLLESCADEIWWLRDGELIARGDPSEVLAQYRRHVAEALRSAGADHAACLCSHHARRRWPRSVGAEWNCWTRTASQPRFFAAAKRCRSGSQFGSLAAWPTRLSAL